MSNRTYKKKVVASTRATVDPIIRSYRYKGFNSKNTKDNFKLYDIDLVKQDLLNHFYIKKGEKLENPEFGTIIWNLLFENFTTEVKKLIADDVETIVNYDPRISVESILVDSTPDGIRIQANLIYLPFNVTEQLTFNFDRRNSIVS
jgi:phage baseplate assembly protein W